jgi:hypothetical protein
MSSVQRASKDCGHQAVLSGQGRHRLQSAVCPVEIRRAGIAGQDAELGQRDRGNRVFD